MSAHANTLAGDYEVLPGNYEDAKREIHSLREQNKQYAEKIAILNTQVNPVR